MRREEGAGDGGSSGEGDVALPVCASPIASPQAAPERGAPEGKGRGARGCRPEAARAAPRPAREVPSSPAQVKPRRSLSLFSRSAVCVWCPGEVPEVLWVPQQGLCGGRGCAGRACAVASLRSAAAGCLASVTPVTA